MAFSWQAELEPLTADLESASATTAPHRMIANKFLGAVGLVQMRFIERDCNLKRFVFYFRHILLWNTNFQEIKFLSWILCCLYPYIHFIRNITSSSLIQLRLQGPGYLYKNFTNPQDFVSHLPPCYIEVFTSGILLLH